MFGFSSPEYIDMENDDVIFLKLVENIIHS